MESGVVNTSGGVVGIDANVVVVGEVEEVVNGEMVGGFGVGEAILR